jgi:hypothetical protein
MIPRLAGSRRFLEESGTTSGEDGDARSPSSNNCSFATPTEYCSVEMVGFDIVQPQAKMMYRYRGGGRFMM